MTTKSGQRRASGEPGSDAEAKKASDQMTEEIEVPDHAEVTTRWRTPGFQRMRYSWNEDDQRVIARAQHEVQRVIAESFSDAYALMYRIYEIVREPELNSEGQPIVDHFGMTQWRRAVDGWFVEDFSLLTRKQREDFLGSLVTSIFTWEQRSAEMWGDAMFAKAQFEERFAIAYDAPISGTVDDRRAIGNKDAAEERYFAIFLSLVSRRSEALVRSMDRLQLRLKDLLMS